jgi:hypothetical protein
MVHAVSFGSGQAKSYANHWIRCKRFLYEKAAGFPLFLRVRCLLLLARAEVTLFGRLPYRLVRGAQRRSC